MADKEEIKDLKAEQVDIAATKTTEVLSYRLVVIGLVLVLVATVIGIIVLPLFGKPIPQELTTIAVPVLTALAAILSPIDRLGVGGQR
jgi:hypothetical protein